MTVTASSPSAKRAPAAWHTACFTLGMVVPLAVPRLQARRRARLATGALLALLSITSDSLAYTVESPVADPCHEELAARALVVVRAGGPTAPTIAPTEDEQALIDDLPFTLGGGVPDLGAAAMLIGVRDNDVKGRRVDELDSLTSVHGDPKAQREHCLRRPEHDEPSGTEAALADCRAFVRERFADALDGLDAAGAPDPARRVNVEVALSVRGKVTASLPAFYVRIGQAMHAVQDAFTHTYRTADGAAITVVLNYVDDANGTLEEKRDGPPHSAQMDRCDDPDALRSLRRAQAQTASTALLHAGLDATLSRDGKLSALEALLDGVLAYQPGCTVDNGWCNAPEHAYDSESGCGCRVAGAPATSGGLLAAAFGLLALARLRRRCLLGGSLVAPPAIAVAVLFVASAARADDTPDPPIDAIVRPVDTTPKTKGTQDPGEPWRSAFGVAPSVSASFDNAALAFTLGLRYRFAERWVAGVDGEWNPFLATNGSTMRSGVFNGYATLIRRWPMFWEPVNLRTTANFGTSVLLMDLYGAPSGSVGLYFGLSPLGIEWKVSRSFYLTADPLHVVLPVPHLTGVPFAYGQYRTTIGAEIDVL